MTVRVLLADDEALVRAGLRMILEAEPGLEVVGEAGRRRRRGDACAGSCGPTSRWSTSACRGSTASRRPGGSRADPELPTAVVMLTTFDADEHVVEALRAGATGFLLKSMPREQLVARGPRGGQRRLAARPDAAAPAARRLRRAGPGSTVRPRCRASAS